MDRKCEDCYYFKWLAEMGGECLHCALDPANGKPLNEKGGKEMKKYKTIIRTTIEFTKTIEAESRNKAVSLALDTLDGTYFKNCGMHDSVHNGKEYVRMDDIMACEEIETKSPLILLCGKSGSGKTTVADLLYHKYGLTPILSYTTRPRRSNMESGHVFASKALFERHIKEGRVIAQADINGYKYWATKEQLDNSDIYVIDPATALDFAERVRDKREVIIVYLTCPETTRVYRMAKRGDSLEDINTRLLIENNWDEYIATIDWRRQRFDSGKNDAEQIAKSIMSVYNYGLTGEWK